MLRSGSLAQSSRQETLSAGPAADSEAPNAVSSAAPDTGGTFPRALPYLPGLDGIRAVAVVAVLLFHLPARLLPGGFLGVDVFFVLSGFLITTLLLAELESTGRVRFGQFYLRRARRLLPALIAVLVVSTVLVLTVARDAASVFREDAIAALTYTTNWWYIFDSRTYFELLGRPPLLQHLWSLGIEEQFYLVWPSVCFLVWRRWRRRGVAVFAVGGALLGTIWMATLGLMQGPLDPTSTARLYFGADTHAMTVLAGAALATVWRPNRLPLRIPASAQVSLAVAGIASLLGLTALFLMTSEDSVWLFRGGFLLVALVTVPLVAAASHPAGAFGAALGTPVLRWLGTRSYGIYLWHWPIFLVTRPDLDIPLRGFWAGVTSLALTFAVAEASYRWIEMPVRRGGLGRWWLTVKSGSTRTRAQAASLVSVIAVTTVIALVALWTVPKVDSTTYLGGVTEVGAGQLTPREEPTDPGSNSGGGSETGSGRQSHHDSGPLWQRHITAVGDSVLLGARSALEDRFPRMVVDAAVGRQPVEIANRVRERIRLQRIGDVLILQTGTNGPPDAEGLEEFLSSLRKLDAVVVLTVRSEVPWMDQSNAIIERAAAGQHTVVVADWPRTSVGHPQYLYKDGTHLTPIGQRAYAHIIWTALREAQAEGLGADR
jgi:peptidoglycan/LPS O-acetylase OafA/YrhL